MKNKIVKTSHDFKKILLTVTTVIVGISMLSGAGAIVAGVIMCDAVKQSAVLFYGSLSPAAVLIVAVFSYCGWLIHQRD